ncbi:MAG: LapA family protein [Pseudomonadota bacterium]
MRTLKYAVIIVIAIALMIVMAANMAPVELHLIPERFAPGLPVLAGVPIALVIVCAFVGGLIIGMLMEMIRERKYRQRLEDKRREVASLKDENGKLSKRLTELGDDVAAATG